MFLYKTFHSNVLQTEVVVPSHSKEKKVDFLN